MSAARKAIEIFNDALEVQSGEREAFIVGAAEDDSSVLIEVRSLLAAHTKAKRSSFLKAPDGRGDEIHKHALADYLAAIGRRVGSYTILDVIGVGGMGVVCRAEQHQPQRIVALKLIRPGVFSPRMQRRFEHEAEMLGRLQHPGIAQIFEAGTAATEHGPQPFFAMELVIGEPLTAYANARSLSLAERLELMSRVCDAVHHAHQKGVIHRDLKPGNILVDQTGQPKILDFGVARATDADTAVTTLQTDVRQLIGTLQYMSPEQCEGDPRALDTRSDIYSLGVICYELLAGELPYAIAERSLPDVITLIREGDRRPMSAIDRIFRGDIETIVEKALAKDKTRRYQSASSLAADIRRQLRHEPIVARPPSAVYQLSKFARRNKAIVAMVLSLFAVLVVGVVATAYQAHAAGQLARHRENALRLLAKLPVDPGPEFLDTQENAMLLKELASSLDPGLDPEIELRVRDIVGMLYFASGQYVRAETQQRRALELYRKRHGKTHQQTLRAVHILAETLLALGRLDQAERLVTGALEDYGYQEAAEARYAVRERGRLLRLQYGLARVLHAQGRLSDAERIYRWTLQRQEALFQAGILTETDALDTTHHLALLLYDRRGGLEEAERMLREALERRRNVSGALSHETIRLVNSLGRVLTARGRLEEAQDHLAQARTWREHKMSPDHPDAIMGDADWARLIQARGETDAARQLFETARARLAERFGPDDYRTRRVAAALADLR